MAESDDIETSSQRNAPTPICISSLPLEVWSACLEFLPPLDMTIASTCLNRQMSTVYSREQAACSTLTHAISKLYGRAVKLERYQEETWMGLYRFFWCLLKAAKNKQKSDFPYYLDESQCEGMSHIDMEGSKASESMNSVDHQVFNNGDDIYSNKHIARATFWLIFGYDEPLSPIATSVTTSDRDIWYILEDVCCKIMSKETIEWKSTHRRRILSSALRLRDFGYWSVASSILTSLVDDKNVCRKADEKQIIGPRDIADINFCICTFLIDQVYSYTTVSKCLSDKLSHAVICGRRAVALCLQCQNNDTGNRMQDRKTKMAAALESSLSLASNLLPEISLHSSDVLRLAASQLALGRALALLTQYIVLNITLKTDATVRLSSDESGFSASGFFKEGEALLTALIVTMTAEQKIDDSLDVLEILAGAYASLGELYYCLCCEYHSSTILNHSIRYLTLSLRMVHDRLVKEEGIQPNVQGLCTGSPRSLMLLQAQTATQLGRVYGFSKGCAGLNRSLFQKNIFYFSLSVTMQYFNTDHPLIGNIRRLEYVEETWDSAEEIVNRMLIDDFLPEYIITN